MGELTSGLTDYRCKIPVLAVSLLFFVSISADADTGKKFEQCVAPDNKIIEDWAAWLSGELYDLEAKVALDEFWALNPQLVFFNDRIDNMSDLSSGDCGSIVSASKALARRYSGERLVPDGLSGSTSGCEATEYRRRLCAIVLSSGDEIEAIKSEVRRRYFRVVNIYNERLRACKGSQKCRSGN